MGFLKHIIVAIATVLAAPLLAQGSSSGDASARYDTARAALAQQDYATAAPILAGLCEEGFVSTCFAAGRLYLLGEGVTPDQAKGLGYLDSACREGDTKSCGFLSLVYDQGGPVEEDQTKAFYYANSGCLFDDGENCWNTAERYRTGQGVERSWVRALGAYRIACNGGLAKACVGMGNVLTGDLYPQEGDPPRDYAAAAAAYRKGCDLGDGLSCSMLADRMETGLGVDKDPAGALELYRRALDMDVPRWVQNSIEGRIRALESAQ